MRKIVASEFISVDGMMSDPGSKMEWVTSIFNDKEGAYQNDLYDRSDTMLLGRTTYGILGGYWPNAASNGASKDELELSKKINRARHVVVAHQPVTFLWENTVQLRELTHDGIAALKQQPGKDIVVVGSATIVQQLASLGLIDEYHLLVHPVVMGKGKPLFKNGDRPLPLQVIGTEEFGNGVTLVRYRALLDATSTADNGRAGKPLAPALDASRPSSTGQLPMA